MPADHSPVDLRVLTRRLRPERRSLVALLLVLLVAMGLPLLGPLLIGRFVDAALGGGSTHTLMRYAALFLLATLAGDGLQLLVTWLSVRLAWRVGNRLRTDLCRHALSLDLAWHGDHSPGQLIERIDGDVDALTRFSSTAVLQLAGNALLAVGTLVVATLIDWRAGLLIGLAAGVAVAILVRMRRIAVPYYDEEREVQGRLYGDLEERLGGLEDLRANGAGAWAVHRLQHHSAAWWRTARRAAVWGDGGLVGASLAFSAGSVLTLGLGVWLNRSGQLSVGSVVALFRFSQQVSDPLWQVSEQLSELQKAAAGTRRAARLFATEPTLVDGSGPRLPDGPLAVDLDAVSFGYGTGHPVVAGLDLHLTPGTSLGVVGRTGSGKTTLGRLLLRMWDTEDGAVRVGGIDLRATTAADLRRRVAVVTQEVEVFRTTVRDNLTLFGALDVSDDRLTEALDAVGLGPWRARLARGLDTELRGDELSAGEAQLLAFARVLLTDPGLVVLDEASSRLDPVTEAGLAAATARLLAGRTAVVIAHRLSTLDTVNEILVLERGRIVEHGRRDDLAADPNSHYARLVSAGLTGGVPR
ncbi:MAG: transporter, ATP-binding/permease protein [Acidimicrobiales bacterium]|nr:transporter, ATP-binding/permease protein [Acidimicrobiales bacterium]